MKPVRLAHPYHTRELTNEAELSRLQAAGWLVLPEPPKPTKPGTRRQRAFLKRRQQAGFRRLDVQLPREVFNDLRARQQQGESLAQLIERLLSSPCDK